MYIIPTWGDGWRRRGLVPAALTAAGWIPEESTGTSPTGLLTRLSHLPRLLFPPACLPRPPAYLARLLTSPASFSHPPAYPARLLTPPACLPRLSHLPRLLTPPASLSRPPAYPTRLPRPAPPPPQGMLPHVRRPSGDVVERYGGVGVPAAATAEFVAFACVAELVATVSGGNSGGGGGGGGGSGEGKGEEEEEEEEQEEGEEGAEEGAEACGRPAGGCGAEERVALLYEAARCGGGEGFRGGVRG